MDRAWRVRVMVRRLLVTAVLVQATTPDLLELSLLADSAPLGRLTAGPLVAPTWSAPRRVVPRDGFQDADAVPPTVAVEAGSEDLCEPIWPEVGLTTVREVRARLPRETTTSDVVLACAGESVVAGRVVVPGTARSALRPRRRIQLRC